MATTPVANVLPAVNRGPFVSLSESRIFGRLSCAHCCAPMSLSQRPISPFPFSASRMVCGRSLLKLVDAS